MIINKKVVILKIISALIFLLVLVFGFYFFKNKYYPALKNLSVTEELSARLKSSDENLIIRQQDSKMWWDNNDGYSLIASSSESIIVTKTTNLGVSNTIADDVFKNELAITRQVFADRGFVLNKANSSASTTDQKFYDYIQAYEKDNYLCAVTVSSDASPYNGLNLQLIPADVSPPANFDNSLNFELYISCTDKLKEAETEQIPFLDALNFRNKEESAELENSDGDYFHIETHFRRSGSAAILKKENGRYRVLLISQEAPRCSLLNKEKIPASVLTSIGSGDCYADDGSTYVMSAENSKKQEALLLKNNITSAEPFSYSLKGLPVTISKKKQAFDFTAAKLEDLAKECGTKYQAGYFDNLIAKFKDAEETVYNFKYQGASQSDLTFTITLVPNKAGYKSLAKFEKDFNQCFIAGDAYPLLLNKDWLLFINSCGSGVDDGSGRPDGCGEVDDAVASTLKLNY